MSLKTISEFDCVLPSEEDTECQVVWAIGRSKLGETYILAGDYVARKASVALHRWGQAPQKYVLPPEASIAWLGDDGLGIVEGFCIFNGKAVTRWYSE